MTGSQAVSVVLEDGLVTLTRALGILRRRNFPIKSIAVGPAGSPGLARLTIMMQTDPTTATRAARQLEKAVGVHGATSFSAREGVAREVALVKVRAGQDRYAELLDLALLYKATIADESAEATMLELGGSESFVVSFLRAIESFDILEVARSGTIALGRAPAGSEAPTLTPEAVP